jgi:hypothetical protein
MVNPHLIPEDKIPSNLEPIDAAPIDPNRPMGAPPLPNGQDNYFQGSIAPNFQHDVTFVGTEYGTPGIAKTPLMPLGVAGNPITNAGVQSTATKVVQKILAAIPPTPTPTPAATFTPTKVWDDHFYFGHSTVADFGELGWAGVGNAATPDIFTSVVQGAFPNIGQVQLYNNPGPGANGGGYIAPGVTNVSAGAQIGPPAVGWQATLPLLDNPGWTVTWVFCVRRPNPAQNINFAFDVTKFSMYVGLANGYGGSSPWQTGPRPPVFYGVRYDTDTTAPSIADSTFHLEACQNAISTTAGQRWNNVGTGGGSVDTLIPIVEGTFHTLTISYLTQDSITMTLDAFTTTFSLTRLSVSNIGLGFNTVSANGTSFVPGNLTGAFSNTNGYHGAAPGNKVTLAGNTGTAVGFSGTFVVQTEGAATWYIPTPGGSSDGTFQGATVTAYSGLVPFASQACDSTGAPASNFSRALVIDRFTFQDSALAVG